MNQMFPKCLLLNTEFLCLQIYYTDSSLFSPYMVKYANLLSDLGIAQILVQRNLFSQGCLLAWMREYRGLCVEVQMP